MRNKEKQVYLPPQTQDEIQAIVDGVDQVAADAEAVWGVDRLELLVDDDLRLRFRRQWQRFNEAIAARDPERVRQTGEGMKRAWAALCAAAVEAKALPLHEDIWEVKLGSGRIVAFCKSLPEAFAVYRSGRYVEVWTAEEVARLIDKLPELSMAKQTFPGAMVVSAKAKGAQDLEK